MTELQTSSWRGPRQIVERIIIKGNLILETPAHFGNGDSSPWSQIDMTLLRDPLEGKALLPGASIAGALRSYLRERQSGYASKEENKALTLLFGGSKGDDKGAQSLLLIDDVLAETEWVELRDGVKIDPATRTADEKKLFSMELLPVGTKFDLQFELLVPEEGRESLVQTLALALQGFEQGEITLGARKRRGFGRCRVSGWQVTPYKLTEGQGLIDWLNEANLEPPVETSIAKALGLSAPPETDARRAFTLKAKFALDSSLLIRSSYDERGVGADTAHLHLRQPNGKAVPLVPGTSWAGVIRHRALRIANTLRPGQGEALVNSLFGAEEDKQKKQPLRAGRVVVEDSPLAQAKLMVQTRIRIDRFTGGAYPTALFEEAPIFGDKTAYLTLKLTLRNPQAHEIGLLLLVLKDLWTGDLPVGGESSVGRGRLQGQTATLTFKALAGPPAELAMKQVGERLEVEEPETLQKYVDKLHQAVWEVTHEPKD